MSTSSADVLESARKAFEAMAHDAKQTDYATKNVAKSLAEMAVQANSHALFAHKSMAEHIAHVIKLPGPLREISKAIVTNEKEVKSRLASLAEEHSKITMEVASRAREYERAANIGQKHVDNAQKEYLSAVKTKDVIEAQMGYEKSLLALHDRVQHSLVGSAAITGIWVKGMTDAVHRSKEINVALIESDSNQQKRYNLTLDILDVQARTGTATNEMAAGAKALLHVGMDQSRNFKETLNTIVMMEEGLGVSFEASAGMARTFTNLKTPVSEVADSIARIVNDTALAADEATRFATEVGNAIRMMGPGVSNEAVRITESINKMAGALKEAGGDQGDFVKMMSTMMSKGTHDAMMMRGIAGVRNPNQLSTAAGSDQAIKNIGKFIDRMVSAIPGTAAYEVQLESAAEMLHTSTANIRYWKEALEKSNKPLDYATTLELRYREQVSETGKTWDRLKGTMAALLNRGFMPFIAGLNWVMKLVLGAVQALAKYEAMGYVMVGVVTAGLVVATVQLTRLGMAAYAAATRFAIANGLMSTTSAMSVGGGLKGLASGLLGKLKYVPGVGASSTSVVSSWAMKKEFFKESFSFLRFIPQIAKGIAGLFTSPLALVALAGAVGYGTGKAINHFFPDFGKAVGQSLERINERFFERGNHVSRANYVGIAGGTKTKEEVLDQIRTSVLKGHPDNLKSILEQNTHLIKGMVREQGLSPFMEEVKGTFTSARELVRMQTVSGRGNDAQADKRDLEMIEALRSVAENSEFQKNILDKILAHQKEVKETNDRNYEKENTDSRIGGTSTKNPYPLGLPTGY